MRGVMIDKLVLRCPFIKDYQTVFSVSGIPIVRETGRPFLKLPDLKIPLYAALDSDGEQIDLIHKWESIPSSYGSMAFKVFDFRDSFGDEDRQSFYIELNASPAKIMQGHNLYGTDALWPCAEAMIHLLINKYPYLTNYLDQAHWSVEQVDLTYHSWCQTENEAIQLVNALQNVSNGQTRGRTGFAGTAYFGKQNSRIKNIKVYVKLLEVINFINKEKKRGDKSKLLKHYTPELLAWIKGAVRWEASLKKRWFERRNINNNLFALSKVFDAQNYFKEATLDIFAALEGKEMKLFDDELIEKELKEKFPTINPRTGNITFGQANNAYRVFKSIKNEGWIETRRITSEGTFRRAIEMLQACGISKAALQNMDADGLRANVIPFIRFIEIKFDQQYPLFVERVA
jgi:II/X family phage/plasmid replication protein